MVLEVSSSAGFNSSFPAIPQDSCQKGFRINRTAQIALHVLTATLAVATLAALACTIALPGPWTVAALAVSAIALTILLTAEYIPSIKPHLSEKMQHVVNMVRSTAMDVFAKVLCGILYPIRQTWFDPKAGKVKKDQTPILLVHGYLHNSSGWAYFRHRLHKAGWANVFTIDLGNPFLPIEEYAKKVEDKAKEIAEITGQDELILIGHSMGGLVSAQYATEESFKGNVKKVITLGTPLRGTKLRGVGACAKQMVFNSSFVQSLQEKIKKSSIQYYHVQSLQEKIKKSPIQYYHIGSKTDLIVRPPLSTVMTQNPHVFLPDLGHVSFLFSDRVIGHCLGCLADASA